MAATATPDYKPSSKPVILVAVIAVIVAAIVIYAKTDLIVTHGPADHSSSIASTIGATSCSNSGFYVESKLTGQKQIIYDCLMGSGDYKCVTEDGGIASDSTDEVKLLFDNTLGSAKPSCVQ